MRRPLLILLAALLVLPATASAKLTRLPGTGELAAKYPGGELGPALGPVPFPAAGGETGTDL